MNNELTEEESSLILANTNLDGVEASTTLQDDDIKKLLEQDSYKKVYDGSFNYGLGDVYGEYKKKVQVEDGVIEVPFKEAWLFSNDPNVVEIAHKGITDAHNLLNNIEKPGGMNR